MSRIYTLFNKIITAIKGKAAAEHTHTAGDITSGTLPLAIGGTGNTNGTAQYLESHKIDVGADLDTISTPGFYFCNTNDGAKQIAHVAEQKAFSLIVNKAAATIQIFTVYATGKTYIRANNVDRQNAWSEWAAVYTTANKPSVGAQKVSDGQNLDDYHGESYIGFYYAGGGNTVTGGPVGTRAFGLLVARSADGQFIQVYWTADGTEWRRIYLSTGAWSAWWKVYDTGHKPTASDVGALAVDGKAKSAAAADAVPWSGVTGKPTISVSEETLIFQ